MTPKKRLVGDARARVASQVAAKYRTGASIRAIARELDCSYGKIHRLLTRDVGITLRSRGGSRGRQKASGGHTT